MKTPVLIEDILDKWKELGVDSAVAANKYQKTRIILS
jgi:hypothetical protein